MFTKKVNCETTNLHTIREFILSSLDEYSVPHAQRDMIVVAVDEVCANRMIHSNSCDPSKEIQVSVFNTSENEVIIEIKDGGDAFDIKTYHSPEITDVIKQHRKGGMGLRLVKNIMDAVHVVQDGNFQVCRLVKQL
ncbi:ATP-binding protein [Flammeovirga yaeyamensis]|uniref:ATP-binding protein n=1 Tax=Flammeovirga yaeyamensis TaxID=367791 RepID=A0AAX1N8Q4_9BACT|nr:MULTISPECIES: ATP-binding protein [Flammeovirga]ANQ50407.2 ATP-binding protein [Flammeovirga sp. MY04]MBB3699636.1 serine/threonine-protein kinase RsbW [Flammeovirga yaeyamensis]NMF36793.1 ATP-binding protein [Flammeovirga yaeyamensis]QWG02168.1 ATP-binding protein [Flammeovirga yaeyamensis]